MPPLRQKLLLSTNLSYDVNCHPLTINISLFKQGNINQMFDKIQMILMMKMSISNSHISQLNNLKDSNGAMYLKVDTLVEMNNIVTFKKSFSI